jgi:polysaccharide pyruvyl transferase CsaB
VPRPPSGEPNRAQILVCGYYGYGNAGDEAILDVLLDDLRTVHGRPSITVVTGRTRQVESAHEVAALDLADVESVIDGALAADLLVLGGGGLFQDYEGIFPDTMLLPNHWGLGYYAGFAFLGRLVGAPVAIYGAGVGPLRTTDGRKLTEAAFGAASSASVRDRASMLLLSELGVDTDRVTLTADPAFLLKDDAPATALKTGPTTIGVSVRPWADGSWIEPLARALDEIVEAHDATIVFVSLQQSDRPHEDDLAVSRSVAGLMRRSERVRIDEDTATPGAIRAAFGTFDLVVGMRLHAIVFAASAGTPVIGLSYDPKVPSMMSELELADYTVDLGSVGDLAPVVARSRSERDFIRQRLASTVGHLRERAAGNAAILRGDGSSGRPAGQVAADLLRHRVFLWRQLEDPDGALKRTQADLQRVSADYQALLSSKALAPARLYWRIRSGRNP